MGRYIHSLAALALLAFGVLFFSDNKADVDLWGNVGFVQHWPASPDFHRTNTFSFTDANHTWIDHEWLSELIFHEVFTRFGNPGLLILKIGLGLLLLTILAIVVTRECRSPPLAFLFLLMLVSTIGYGFSTRPHLFTYILVSLFLFSLKYHSRSPHVLLILLPAMGLLWTNLHGAFFIGIVLVLLFSAIETLKSFRRKERPTAAILAGLSALLLVGVSFVNPYGFHLWEFILRSAAKPRPYLSEWAPFNPFTDIPDHTDFAVLVLLSLIGLALSRHRRDGTWATLFLVSLAAAFCLRRNIPLFAIVAAFSAPAWLDEIAGKGVDRLFSRSRPFVLPALLCLFIIACVWQAVRRNRLDRLQIDVPQDRFPSHVVAFLDTHAVKGNALVFFDWAEYCIWRLYPNCRVFLDGRFNDAYRATTIDDYFLFLSGNPGWESALRNYPVDIVLLHRETPVFEHMRKLEGWTLVYSDRLAALFLKNDRHADLITMMKDGGVAVPMPSKEVFFPR